MPPTSAQPQVPYTSIAGCEGPAYFGLEPERIKLYNVQAGARIAAEKAAEEKAEEARMQLGEFFGFPRGGDPSRVSLWDPLCYAQLKI